MKPAGSSSVMAARKSPRSAVEARKAKRAAKHHTSKPKPESKTKPTDPRDGLDFFPTPPWATRAVLEHALPGLKAVAGLLRCWEPCCGEGHMAEPLREYFGEVYASDVYPHGYGAVGSFVTSGDLDLGDRASCPFRPDWVFMNPPFSLALEFAERALAEARRGVAMLVRTGWIETAERYRLFCRHEPTLVAVFAERVPMVEFRWDPEASSATSYAWFVWERDSEGLFPPAKEGVPVFPTVIIPPVCRDTLLFRHDLRLARAEDRSLFDGGA